MKVRTKERLFDFFVDFLFFFALFIIYGVLTQCPDTAIYQYCGLPWGRS